MKENYIIYKREKKAEGKRENKSETKPDPSESVPIYALKQWASCIVLHTVGGKVHIHEEMLLSKVAFALIQFSPQSVFREWICLQLQQLGKLI